MTTSTTPVTPCPICNRRTCDASNLHTENLLKGVRTTDVRVSLHNPNYRDPIGK